MYMSQHTYAAEISSVEPAINGKFDFTEFTLRPSRRKNGLDSGGNQGRRWVAYEEAVMGAQESYIGHCFTDRVSESHDDWKRSRQCLTMSLSNPSTSGVGIVRERGPSVFGRSGVFIRGISLVWVRELQPKRVSLSTEINSDGADVIRVFAAGSATDRLIAGKKEVSVFFSSCLDR